jgi:DegV family protein with EDD domain
MIKIIADSTCDLSEDILNAYQISIAPLSIEINGKTYLDRIDLQPDDFYAILASLKNNPTTAAPSPNTFLELMESAVLESSGTSASFQSASIARELFYEAEPDRPERVHVVDSRSMSHGSGYLILKSARLRDQGMSFESLIDFNESFKTHVKHFLSVDDLDNLIRSGRLTNASAFIGKLLKIKPIMSMRDGKGVIVAKERGRKNVLDHYVQEFIKRNDSEMTDFVIIGYTSDRAYAENLKVKLLAETSFEGEVLVQQMGVAVGTHVGLGGLSMYFIEKNRAHDGLLANEMNIFKKKRDEIIEAMKQFTPGNRK